MASTLRRTSKLRDAIELVLSKSPLDVNALAFDITEISQPLTKRLASAGRGITREISDPGQFLWLLRLSKLDASEK